MDTINMADGYLPLRHFFRIRNAHASTSDADSANPSIIRQITAPPNAARRLAPCFYKIYIENNNI